MEVSAVADEVRLYVKMSMFLRVICMISSKWTHLWLAMFFMRLYDWIWEQQDGFWLNLVWMLYRWKLS
jgi:hypothetical protein